MVKLINGLVKFTRYVSVYGLSRTLTKVAGRTRVSFLLKKFYFSKVPSIGLIGCGQFQFSTIAYFLSKGVTNRFSFCYDIKQTNSNSIAKYYSIPEVLTNIDQIPKNEFNVVYIASNHASHTDYAIKYLNDSKNVYCEKPISVTFGQFDLLLNAIINNNAKFFAGYNRPYSAAVQEIKKHFLNSDQATGRFTIGCFISAHHLPRDHWYRNPEEGTRICGNVGHWIDLMIHMLNWRGKIPLSFNVQITYSDMNIPDDNISISLTTDYGDLTTITISARSEPFEGINETINFQYDSIIAKIDDFRSITIWNNEKLIRKKYRPKDVGHKRSVMQPFMNDNRELKEVIASTELMLHITDMVKNLETQRKINLTRSL